MPATPSFPKARVLDTHTRIRTHSSARLSKGFPCVADESTRGVEGPTMEEHNGEAGEGSCSLRAAAIKARGGRGGHLAAEHHSHSARFCLQGQTGGKGGRGPAERRAAAAFKRATGGRRGASVAWEGRGGIKKFYILKKERRGTCSTLLQHTWGR